jgi:hypothetical protein
MTNSRTTPTRLLPRPHIGSPRRLNDSHNHGGHACSFAEIANQAPVERIHVALHRLRPRASVHMRYRWNHAALFRFHLCGQNHERRVRGGLDVLVCHFCEHLGRKRPPSFAKLYRVVYLGIHFRIAGIRCGFAVLLSAARIETHHDCWTGMDSTPVNFGDFAGRSCDLDSFCTPRRYLRCLVETTQ